MKELTLHVDGSCLGNPGPGGYGVTLMFGRHRKELSSGYRLTTNNRMELMAVIKGLEALTEKCRVELWSDSTYVVDALSEGWAVRWRANGWRRNEKESASNADLWSELLQLCDYHNVTFNWVKGHSGNPENERCDQLAKEAANRPNLPADEEYEAMAHLPTLQMSAPEQQITVESPTVGVAQLVKDGLASPEAGERKKAVFRAVEEQLTELAPALLELMQSEADLDFKSRCAWALGGLNYRDAHPHLVNNLIHRSRVVRTWSAWALGEIGEEKAKRPLLRAKAKEELDDVRQAIGGALKKLGFGPVRAHRSQLAKALHPPATEDSTLLAIVERLEELEWPRDSKQVVEARADMKRCDPGYFDLYMKWAKQKPAVLAALEDDRKVFS